MSWLRHCLFKAMVKYIVFFVLLAVLILNFSAQKVMELVLKREANEKQVITFKLILYAVTLIGVVYIMFINK